MFRLVGKKRKELINRLGLFKGRGACSLTEEGEESLPGSFAVMIRESSNSQMFPWFCGRSPRVTAENTATQNTYTTDL